ncbi:ABC transporter substrate-binding protein [Jiangella anatolica]|uniref:Solute-binding protein family 5 domain-containing protein n=1 Tax=Jiangella anatolica TaxID=2670374 RepID=A0A2W2B4Q3_9ACTN|nr:ABC transporter substrate-binding protein [Jiangella anatolica]PZF82365.1 hypothetical protein C1I92_17215 [Jiangella anatolica]
MKRRVLTIAAISGTALLLAGCGDDTDTADGGSVPETVAIGIRADIDVFDPNKSIGDIGAAQAFALLYDGLVRTSPDGEITPGLAESWDVTPLGGTFTLREGITCSDGTALTASDIAKSIEYVADPANGSPGASRVFGFGGAKSITADDTANTVTIELNAPNNDMLAGLTNVARIVCPAGLEDPEALATTPLGTGPYELTAQQRGESYTFTLRDDYVAYPEGVTAEDMPREVQLRVVADDSTQANLLTSGELTIANLQGQAVERVQGQEGINEIDSEAWGVTGLAINHDTPVGGNADLRRAIALALDPELYNKAAYGGQAKPASALYTSNMACYSEEIGEAQVRGDLDAAAALLDEKGFALSGDVRTNPDGSPLTIRMMQLATNPTEAEYVKDALSQVGLTVELQSLSYNEALENLYTDGWDLITIPYQSGIASPSLYVLQVSGPLEESLNFGRIQNAAYEALVPEALAAETEEARCAAWNDAQEALLAEADLVPLVQVVSQYFADGLTFSAAGKIDPFSFKAD